MPVAAAIPIAAATVGSTALNVAGGLFSNKTNKKIARETNALNYQMFQEANDYNTRMWNAANQYNLPINQKQRLLDAGVNPAALVDSPQLGSVTNNAPGSVSPPQMQGYQYQNVLGNFGNDMVAFTQALKNVQEAKGQSIDNSNKDALFVATIDQMEAAGLLSREQAAKWRSDTELQEASFTELLQKLYNESRYVGFQADIAKIQKVLTDKYGDELKQKEIEEVSKRIALLIEQGKTEEAQQELNKALGHKAEMDAESNRMLATSGAAANYASAEESRTRSQLNISQKQKQDLENEVYQMFGKSQAAATFLKDFYDGKLKSYDDYERWFETEVLKSPLGSGAKATGTFLEYLLPILGRIGIKF